MASGVIQLREQCAREDPGAVESRLTAIDWLEVVGSPGDAAHQPLNAD